MSIHVVSAVMHSANGISKLVHGLIDKENSESTIGAMTTIWLKQYPGFALEKIIASEVSEDIFKRKEVSQEEDIKPPKEGIAEHNMLDTAG